MKIPYIQDSYFDQFTTGKYRSKSLVQRSAIRHFMTDLQKLVIQAGAPSNVLEVGCGEGFISGHLANQYPDAEFTGLDIHRPYIEEMMNLFPKIKSSSVNFFDFEISPKKFDTIICCEVLEHLEEPEKAIDRFHQLQPNFLILSVPNEPFFQMTCLMRGINVSNWGNPKDHINHWNFFSFKKLLSAKFKIITIKTPYPWLMVLARPINN